MDGVSARLCSVVLQALNQYLLLLLLLLLLHLLWCAGVP
jgi:hypothetical protein